MLVVKLHSNLLYDIGKRSIWQAVRVYVCDYSSRVVTLKILVYSTKNTGFFLSVARLAIGELTNLRMSHGTFY